MLFARAESRQHQPLMRLPQQLVPLALLALSSISGANEVTANNAAAATIRITADSAEQDQQRGLTHYRGHVRIVQDGLQIDADNATIIHASDPDTTAHRGVDAITAEGRPAQITLQAGEHGGSRIAASGNALHYQLEQALISLRGNATIDRDGSRVSGDKIEYFIHDNHVKAAADPNGQQGRVHTIITPTTNSTATKTTPKVP